MKRWEQSLSQAGHRVTAPRRAVMGVLSRARTPLSPQEIFERGRAIHANLGLVTVYRTLELFEDLDLVRRVHQGEGCQGYLLATPGHCHVVVCRQCGQAVEFPGRKEMDALIAQVETKTGFMVDGHLLQLFGLCGGCQKNEE